MHLVFDIFQGIGVAAAVGIRPFLPALVVGALGAANLQIDFSHTDFSFLERPVFLLVMVIGAILLAVVERRQGQRRRLQDGPAALVLAGIGLAVGALLFGGALRQDHYAFWPGLIGGVICAAIGLMASRPLLARVHARLDADSAGVLPVITEAFAVLAAALSVVLPPVGIVLLAALLWLLLAGRGRTESKYAGLRILR